MDRDKDDKVDEDQCTIVGQANFDAVITVVDEVMVVAQYTC